MTRNKSSRNSYDKPSTWMNAIEDKTPLIPQVNICFNGSGATTQVCAIKPGLDINRVAGSAELEQLRDLGVTDARTYLYLEARYQALRKRFQTEVQKHLELMEKSPLFSGQSDELTGALAADLLREITLDNREPRLAFATPERIASFIKLYDESSTDQTIEIDESMRETELRNKAKELNGLTRKLNGVIEACTNFSVNTRTDCDKDHISAFDRYPSDPNAKATNR